MLHRRQMVFRIIQMKILVRMSQTYSCQRLPMPFNILRTTSHQALMKFLLSWLSMLMSQVQKLSSISVTGFGKQKDGLLIGKIQLSLQFPKKVMSANARTIAPISHLSKILLHIINERLRPILDRELPAEQAGFRRGRGTRDQISNIRHILEMCTEFNRKIYFCFIEYAKAFDCVGHSALWKALLEMGVPTHFVKLISNLYDNQQACVRTEKGDSDWFNIGQGVRQGCILSPTLFNLYAEYIMRRVLENWNGGLSIGGYKLSNLRYADDTTLVATSALELEKLLLIVKAKSEALGLRLNVSKIKIMIVGSDGNEDPIVVDGTEVEHVTQFNFLGSLITTSSGCSTELRRRMAMAKSAMVGLNKIWTDRGITKATKKAPGLCANFSNCYIRMRILDINKSRPV